MIYEAEVGYQFTDHMFLSANVYDITIRDPILYYFNDATDTGYKNFDRTGSRGLELEYKVKYEKISAALNYSFYSARDKNTVPDYAIAEAPDLLLGFPAHKLALSTTLKITPNLQITPSAVWSSERYGDRVYLTPSKLPAELLINVFGSYKDLGVKGLEVGLGFYNILNQTTYFAQPYASTQAPIPGPSRQIAGRINYTYTFQ